MLADIYPLQLTKSLFFLDHGKINKVKRPEYGELVLKFKSGEPYGAEVTQKLKTFKS